MDFFGIRSSPLMAIIYKFIIVICFFVAECSAGYDYTLEVISTNSSGFVRHYAECDARGAQFGRTVTSDDTVAGCTVAASPIFACEPIDPAPARNSSFECIGGYFAVVERGNCTFVQKTYHAQLAGYNGVIVYNTNEEPDEMASDPKFTPRIVIPAFMVGHHCGKMLSDQYAYDKGFSFYIHVVWSYNDLLRYLVPFVAVVGVCFVIMLSAMVVKLLRDRRRRQKRRLSKKHLKKIPTRKFASGDPPETCPICLDEFEVGDRLRVLPCSHTYHANCIDPWLLKNRRVCPICKRKVLPKQGASSHSDSETDETATTNGAGQSLTPSTPGRTPLLINEEHNVTIGNSTFYGIHDAPSGRGFANGDLATVAVSSIESECGTSASTSDGQSMSDDPTIDMDSRQALIPRLSIRSSLDECTQAGFVTASSSLREGYANPNFVVDAQEFDDAATSGEKLGSGLNVV